MVVQGRVRAARYSADIDVPIYFPEDSAEFDEVTQMVLFGGSLSDTGRLKHHVQIFRSSPYWLGRFSDGPVWPDYLEGSTNDYISKEPITGLITTFLNSPDSELGYKLVVDETIVGIAGQVRTLHQAGARKHAATRVSSR